MESTSLNNEESQNKRRLYESPELIKYGKVEEITLGGGSASADAGAFAAVPSIITGGD